jgi:hypothetical protein
MNLRAQDKGVADGVHRPWRHITEEQLIVYYNQVPNDATSSTETIAAVLGLTKHHSDVREAARVTCTVTALTFASEHHFHLVKCGVLFNICQTMLAAVAQPMPRDATKQGVPPSFPEILASDSCSVDGLFQASTRLSSLLHGQPNQSQKINRHGAVLKDLLIPLTRAHPAPSSPFFSAQDVAAIAAFFAQGLFQHFHLYQAVFTQDRLTETTCIEEFVEVPFMPGFHNVAVEGTLSTQGSKQRALTMPFVMCALMLPLKGAPEPNLHVITRTCRHAKADPQCPTNTG